MQRGPTTLGSLRRSYRELLNLSPSDLMVVDFIASLVAANMLGYQQDMVWGYIVGPPGTGKTECVLPLRGLPFMEFINSLTERTLVSGLVPDDGQDHSLLPKLNGKVMVVTDFTNMMTMNPQSIREIMGQLRPIYDCGEYRKDFGTTSRRYKSQFGLLACVTPDIDEFLRKDQSLGERCVKFRMFRKVRDRKALLEWIFDSASVKDRTRAELADQMVRLLKPLQKAKRRPFTPEITDEVKRQVIGAADLVARARTLPKSNGELNEPELSSRLQLQIRNLCSARMMLEGRDAWNERDVKLGLRVLSDTIPAEVVRILRSLAKSGLHGLTPYELASKAAIGTTRAGYILRQYQVNEITRKVGDNRWTLTPDDAKLVGELL